MEQRKGILNSFFLDALKNRGVVGKPATQSFFSGYLPVVRLIQISRLVAATKKMYQTTVKNDSTVLLGESNNGSKKAVQ
jgi:hypothetical protein